MSTTNPSCFFGQLIHIHFLRHLLLAPWNALLHFCNNLTDTFATYLITFFPPKKPSQFRRVLAFQTRTQIPYATATRYICAATLPFFQRLYLAGLLTDSLHISFRHTSDHWLHAPLLKLRFVLLPAQLSPLPYTHVLEAFWLCKNAT